MPYYDIPIGNIPDADIVKGLDVATFKTHKRLAKNLGSEFQI